MFHIFDLFTLCFCCFWFCINIAVKRTSWLYLFFLTTPNPVFIPSVLNITRNRVGPKGCIDPFVVAISKNPFLPLSGKCYLLWLRWSRFFQKAYHLVNMLNLGLITRVSFLSLKTSELIKLSTRAIFLNLSTCSGSSLPTD